MLSSFKKFTVALAFIVAAAKAQQTVDAAEVAEMQALLNDVSSHLTEYMSFAMNNPSFTLPSGVLQVYEQMTTYTNDGYTSLFTEINFSEVSTVLRELPWYSSRIEPLITSVMAAESADASVSYHLSTHVSSSVVTEVHTNVITRQASAASNDTVSAAASDSDMSAATTDMSSAASDDTASSATDSVSGSATDSASDSDSASASAADSTAASEVVTVISGVTVTVPATELSALGLATASVTGYSNDTMSATSSAANVSTATITTSGSAMYNMTNTTVMSSSDRSRTSDRSSTSDRTDTRTSTHHDGANLLTAGLGAVVAGAVALLL